MKIGIVGCGNVGSSIAFACALQGIGTELVLVDKNVELARAQAEDILHATPFGRPVGVRAGLYDDLTGAGIVIIAAGSNHSPGQTRLDLLERNAKVFSVIVPAVHKAAPDAIYLIATNPVDVMSHLTANLIQGKAGKIIGSGTILDTARFRTLLGQHLGVSPSSVHANVLGEHGESEVLHWSEITVGNTPLADFAAQISAPLTRAIKDRIDDGVRHAATHIIEGKGATWYGIGAGVARIARAIINNENTVMTCSTTLPHVEGVTNVTLSLPVVIGAEGIRQAIYPTLDDHEKESLRRSCTILRAACESLRL